MPDQQMTPLAVDPVADEIVHVTQLEPLAQERIEPKLWDYVSGGAADELTLVDNRAAWSRIKLAPHMLVDVSQIDTSISILGQRLPHPILLAPTAIHRSYTAEGELATVRGAHAGETLFIQSSLASMPLRPIAQEASALGVPWWFQLYVQHDREWTADLVAQAVEFGAQALVVTVDTPTLGARDRDKRNNLGAAQGTVYPILDGAPLRPDNTPAHRRIYNPHLSPDITWNDFEWLVEISPVPVVPKGVLRADDAVRAVDSGAQAILVSNHGARNLDTVPATADALPGIIDAVGDRVPVVVDGGIRRGTDVAKALAMGATCVLIGRPYIWGLATYGERGVTHVVEMLRTELEMAMALLGTPTVNDLTPDAFWTGR